MVDKWNKFWFEKVSARNLALIRIFLGISLLLKITDYTGIYRFFNLGQKFNIHYFNQESQYFLDHFRMPYSLFEWLPVPSFEIFNTIENIILILAVLFTVGLFTRFVGPVLAVLYGYVFFLSQLFYHHHIFLLVIALFIVGFSKSAEFYSIDSFIKKRRGRVEKTNTSILPYRLIQVQLTFLYAGSLANKLNEGWFSGDVFKIVVDNISDGPIAELFLKGMNPIIGSWIIIIAIGVVLFGLWIPKLRNLALYCGVLLHLMIDATMNVNSYSYTVLALYVAFIDHKEGIHSIVLYDGYCLMCKRSRKFIQFFDWFKRVEFVDIYDKERIQELKIELPTDEELLKDMHLITKNKQFLKGFYAWRKIFGVLPLIFIITPLLYIPFVPKMGSIIYEYIATNRTRVTNN